jgi:hypothetical protein
MKLLHCLFLAAIPATLATQATLGCALARPRPLAPAIPKATAVATPATDRWDCWPKASYSPAQVTTILHLRAQGESLKAVARRVGGTRQDVRAVERQQRKRRGPARGCAIPDRRCARQRSPPPATHLPRGVQAHEPLARTTAGPHPVRTGAHPALPGAAGRGRLNAGSGAIRPRDQAARRRTTGGGFNR